MPHYSLFSLFSICSFMPYHNSKSSSKVKYSIQMWARCSESPLPLLLSESKHVDNVIASARVLPIVYELIWTQNWSFNCCIFIPVLGLDLGVLELFTSTAEPVNISSIFSMGVLSGSKKKGSSGNWASVNIGGLFPFTQTIPQSLLLLFLLSLQYSWAA